MGTKRANDLLRIVLSGDSREMLKALQAWQVTREEINMPDKNGRTCLSYAASSCDVIMLDLLLATGLIDPNLPDTEGNTPLIYAASLGHSVVVIKLLKNHHTDIDRSNINGFTALMKAAIHDNKACLELLLKAGAGAEKSDLVRGMTALEWARLCSSKDCIKILKKFKLHSKPNSKSANLSRSATDLRYTTPHQSSKPLIKKIKSSFSYCKTSTPSKENLGVGGIISCASTPAIPLLLACSTNGDSPSEYTCIVNPLVSQKLCYNVYAGNNKHSAVLPPKIEIITESGEHIEPNKNVYSSSITRRHQQISQAVM